MTLLRLATIKLNIHKFSLLHWRYLMQSQFLVTLVKTLEAICLLQRVAIWLTWFSNPTPQFWKAKFWTLFIEISWRVERRYFPERNLYKHNFEPKWIKAINVVFCGFFSLISLKWDAVTFGRIGPLQIINCSFSRDELISHFWINWQFCGESNRRRKADWWRRS